MFDYSEPDKSLYIQKRYPISDNEYEELNKKYGKLCWFAATKLARSNKKDEEELQDLHSEIQIGMFRAGSYYKRQIYINNAFEYIEDLNEYLAHEDKDHFETLKNKWINKCRFKEKDENILDSIIKKLSLYKEKTDIQVPNSKTKLIIDEKFNIYCKAIIWNTTKCLGQHISKENETKNKEISLDEWMFLEGGDKTTMIDNKISSYYSYAQDFASIKKTLKKKKSKTFEVFDLISDPLNEKDVFKTKTIKDNKSFKMNFLRKKTKLSKSSINDRLSIIKQTLIEECY